METVVIRVERWDERTQSTVLVQAKNASDLVETLADAADMLAGARHGHPTATLVRADGSTLSLSTDGRRCLVVWINSLTESAHSVGGRPGPDLVYDFNGSYSEAPHEWTVPLADAIECAHRFIEVGAPDTESVMFEPD